MSLEFVRCIKGETIMLETTARWGHNVLLAGAALVTLALIWEIV
jgi:hypothetical protein